MKFLRKSPVVIAATAVIAAPSAIADPVVLTPPAQSETQTAPPQPPLPPPPATVVTPTSPPPEAPPLRGPTGPLPTDLSPIAAPAPPAPPPAAPPPPPPPPAVTTPVAAAPPPPPPPPRVAPEPTASVTVGLQEGYTRLAFAFAGATSVTPTLTGNRLELRFSRGADIDISELRANLPRFVRDVRRLSAPGAPVRLALTLDPGVHPRNFADGNRVIVDLLAPDPATSTTAADGTTVAPVPARPPVTGIGRVQLVEGANDTTVTITWNAAARAAAFRRGEAIWILFDANNARMDLAGVARAGRRHQDIEVIRGEGVAGLRIAAPPDIQVSAAATDNTWTFTLGARAAPSEHAALTRQVSAEGAGTLTVNFARDGAVRWVTDPEIGDRIAVALIGGPAKGIDARRATVEAAVLPTAHGAVIEPRADGVTAVFDHGNLVVSNGQQGLIAASAPPANAAATQVNAVLLEQALDNGGAEPDAQVRAQRGLTLAQVRARIETLTRRAASEGTMEGAPITARMELARFLVENELAPEALGALRLAAVNQGDLVEIDPEYRLLRGAANVMMGRNEAALADLNTSALNDNLSAALWRGYAAAQKADWQTARRELERGIGAMEEHPPAWRARFQLALAQSAFELGDNAAAEAASRAAMGQAPDEGIRLRARLIEARLMAARNDPTHALALFDELARGHDEEVAVRAQLEAIRLRRATGVMRAVDVIEPLEALRFRWRGDSLELATVATLGDVYSELGRWRDALGVMRQTAERYPMNPEARRLQADMQTLFERLFLDGEADQLEPIQALGLFYEFSDLTPVGPNGDRIVRLLAGRLVQVDLLEQAAQLLQHQVDERLQGLSKAQVAGDLAAIYLMDDKPDRALVALAGSRQPNMPAPLLAERRILEARALLGLGRLDNAVELVERDRSADAQAVRAEAAWRARDWDRASAELHTLLGMRDRALPFGESDRQMVLRAGIAMTLAGNDAGVRQLYRDYAGDMANSPEADAFEVVASGINAEGASIREVARAVARTDLLDRFMTRVRARMTAEAPPAPQTPGTPPPAAPPPQAQAAPPAAPPRREAGT